ncbi:unnamed protein product [Amoebophrya sp. A120]|nr:unnamed protein product [Amoebophrya sp. A120]|eukprot:GSA120T00025640001.1
MSLLHKKGDTLPPTPGKLYVARSDGLGGKFLGAKAFIERSGGGGQWVEWKANQQVQTFLNKLLGGGGPSSTIHVINLQGGLAEYSWEGETKEKKEGEKNDASSKSDSDAKSENDDDQPEPLLVAASDDAAKSNDEIAAEGDGGGEDTGRSKKRKLQGGGEGNGRDVVLKPEHASAAPAQVEADAAPEPGSMTTEDYIREYHGMKMKMDAAKDFRSFLENKTNKLAAMEINFSKPAFASSYTFEQESVQFAPEPPSSGEDEDVQMQDQDPAKKNEKNPTDNQKEVWLEEGPFMASEFMESMNLQPRINVDLSKITVAKDRKEAEEKKKDAEDQIANSKFPRLPDGGGPSARLAMNEMNKEITTWAQEWELFIGNKRAPWLEKGVIQAKKPGGKEPITQGMDDKKQIYAYLKKREREISTKHNLFRLQPNHAGTYMTVVDLRQSIVTGHGGSLQAFVEWQCKLAAGAIASKFNHGWNNEEKKLLALKLALDTSVRELEDAVKESTMGSAQVGALRDAVGEASKALQDQLAKCWREEETKDGGFHGRVAKFEPLFLHEEPRVGVASLEAEHCDDFVLKVKTAEYRKGAKSPKGCDAGIPFLIRHNRSQAIVAVGVLSKVVHLKTKADLLDHITSRGYKSNPDRGTKAVAKWLGLPNVKAEDLGEPRPPLTWETCNFKPVMAYELDRITPLKDPPKIEDVGNTWLNGVRIIDYPSPYIMQSLQQARAEHKRQEKPLLLLHPPLRDFSAKAATGQTPATVELCRAPFHKDNFQ